MTELSLKQKNVLRHVTRKASVPLLSMNITYDLGSDPGWKIFALVSGRGVQADFRTRIRQDSAHFQQNGSDPDYGFIQGFSNFIFLGFDANTIIKRIFAKI